MSSTTASSFFRVPRNNKSTTTTNGQAVLVTAPHIASDTVNDDGAMVETETCQDVDVSSSKAGPLRRFLETNFGKPSQPQPDQELEEVIGGEGRATRPTKRESVESYDICREYSEDAYDSDSELNSHYFNNNNSAMKSSATAQQHDTTTSMVQYVLGKTYQGGGDASIRRQDEMSLFWFTYRCDFECIIDPYGISSDAGWGCMLRALQMLQAQALRLHYKSRDWKPHHSVFNRRHDPFCRSILTWFADFPSGNQSIYSLHNMVAAGLAKYDKLPGEWYGPGTACHVLRDLVEMHEKLDRSMFRVHVAADAGTVYRDAIERTMTRDTQARLDKEKQEKNKDLPPPAHPLAWEEIGVAGNDIAEQIEWDTSLLLLIPLRLGLKSFNADYVQAVAHTFSLPQSVGVLGGRPRGARWFYGAVADGSKIFGLDPHTVQDAPKRRGDGSVELTDEYLRSVHTTYPEIFSLTKMDPSIALGFYCRDRSDVESVFESLRLWKLAHPGSPELFTVADTTPNYTACSSSAMEDMMDSMLDVEDDGGNASEEDEYIML